MFGYDAARWHAILNDLPAALLTVAVLFDIAAAATKRESLMWAAIWTLWAGVIGGWAAVVAGKLAERTIEHGDAIHEIMDKHQNMALITMALFTVVLAWRLVRRLQMPPQELALTRMLSIVGIAALVWTGILGGRLVFEHAAGIPSRTLQVELENREAGHQHQPGEEQAPADTTKASAPHTHPPGTPAHSH
ncbi:MAG TPA: DUF2231 domain-containing protein [Gemmatimonadales bacterium]|jgi:uncharacterized membrane protein|nr:DUF2231 domain-containing protein [Gemmatimonadales bacterium]